jgi:hypothetical protein
MAANVSHFVDSCTYYELVWLLVKTLHATVEEGIVSPELAVEVTDQIGSYEELLKQNPYNN